MLKTLFKPYSVESCIFNASHRCATMADAIAWAACYPNQDVVSIYRRGVLVSMRYGRI